MGAMGAWRRGSLFCLERPRGIPQGSDVYAETRKTEEQAVNQASGVSGPGGRSHTSKELQARESLAHWRN